MWEKFGEPLLLVVAATYTNYHSARLAERTWHKQLGLS